MMDIDALYKIFLSSTGVSIDTRKMTAGVLFFALKGDKNNGSAFAEEAIRKGAYMAVIDDPTFNIPGKTFLVTDTLRALQLLAHHHRGQFDIPVIAITGSNGKTTSKELAQKVLSKKYNITYTRGNLNNHIGVPLTLLNINASTELALVEMGANHQQEIALLCQIAKPTHGLICSIGKAHLEGFGGLEGVKKGKGELYDYLLENKGTILINLSTPFLKEILREREGNIVRYGLHNTNIYGEIISEQPFVTGRIHYMDKSIAISSHLIGSYNFGNIINAFALGTFFSVPVSDIISAIEAYIPDNNRSEVRQMGDYEIILDAYNANPTSMSYAIQYFNSRKEVNKILIIGDMFELGADATSEHQAIADQVAATTIKTVVFVGPLLGATAHPVYFSSFPSSVEAREWWTNFDKKGSLVLVKGSRSMGLEKIFDL